MKKVVQLAIGVGLGIIVGLGIGEHNVISNQSQTTENEVKVNKTLEEVAMIEIGTTQEEVHRRLGKPDSGLSGLYGDIYRIEDTHVIFYYAFDEVKGFPVTEIKITPLDE